MMHKNTAKALVRDVFLAEGRSFLLKDEPELVCGLEEAIAAALLAAEREAQATMAQLEAQLDRSMRRQETLAANVQDGLLEIQALKDQLARWQP